MNGNINSKYVMRDAGTVKYLDFTNINTPTTNPNNPNIQISKIAGMKSMDNQLAQFVSGWQNNQCSSHKTYSMTTFPLDNPGETVNAFCPPLVDTKNKKWYSNIDSLTSQSIVNYNIFSPFINPDAFGDTSKGLGPFTFMDKVAGTSMYHATISYNLESGDPVPPRCAEVSNDGNCSVQFYNKFDPSGGDFGNIQKDYCVFSTLIQSAHNWGSAGPAMWQNPYTYRIYIYHEKPTGDKLPLSGWKMLLIDSSGPIKTPNKEFVGKDITIEFALCNGTCAPINCTECTPVSTSPPLRPSGPSPPGKKPPGKKPPGKKPPGKKPLTSSGLSTLVIIGIFVGSVVIIGGIILSIYFAKKKEK